MNSSLSHTRRSFIQTAALALPAIHIAKQAQSAPGTIRLGGPLFEKYDSPEAWVNAVKKLGYSAAYCPVGASASDDEIKAYEAAANQAGIIIAEVGAWSNPMAPDEAERKKALEKCVNGLALADRIGARCCVNISGSRGAEWAGHHPLNLTPETFDMIVETTRKIIDDAKPTRTFYTLETMPWAYPDSPGAIVDLIHAIDRKQYAAHMDPVNIVSSPQRYHNNGALIRECFDKFGEHIKSCHAKDIALSQNLTVHLDEIIPGRGNLNYSVYLKRISELQDVPLMLEHLGTAEEYNQAAKYIRSVAERNGLDIS